MRQRFYFFLVALFLPMLAYSQIDKDMKEFNDFVKQQQKEFDSFVEEQNQEFANFLKETWKEFDLEKPVDRPQRPEPVKPVVFDKKKPVGKPQEVKVSGVTKLPIPVIKPSSNQPIASGDRKTPVPVLDGGKTQLAKPSERSNITPTRPVKKPNPKPTVKPTPKPVTKPSTNKPVTNPDSSITLDELANANKPTTKPTTPVVTKPDTKPVTQPETKPIVVQPIVKQPTEPEPTKKPATSPSRSGLQLSFYGETCYVDESLKNRLSLNGISENDIANAWESLCRANYQRLINDCQAIKKEYALNDWGYLLLSKQVADALCGKSRTNEVALMQMFILCQSGYKAKVARVGGSLVLFYGSNDMIYAATYITQQGTRYYMFNHKGGSGMSIYTYNRDFANSTRLINMSITSEQMFQGPIKSRQLKARDYKVTVQSEVNSGLIDFYKDYPQCDFSVYVGAPVGKLVQQSVLPTLRAAIQGKSETEAANILLNFVQTAFEYATDDQQFGYEKPFFVDELFYYPYCDCEDRAVLYSYLVRTLMGIDAVLLDYPEHIATAVCFTENVNGDFVTVNGKKYIICDPTYIGASIGNAMPQFKNVSVKVLKYN